MLALDGKPSVTATYDLQRAQVAAQHRRQRKGELSLNQRTRGFMTRVGGLFIPKSGTESSAIISSPESKLIQQQHFVRGLIRDKYEDTGVAPERIRQWGHFAAQRIEYRTVGRQYNYIIDSLMDFSAICQALEVPGLTYDGDSIRESSAALNGIAGYLVTLRSFVGADRSEDKRRQWIQPRWVKRRATAFAWAHEQINAMPNFELEAVYDEAFYNSWSREQYWQAWDKAHKQRRFELAHAEPDHIPIPIEAYERDLDPNEVIDESEILD